jgi:hypothetical protein
MSIKSADSLQARVKWNNSKIIIALCHLTSYIDAAFGTALSPDGKSFAFLSLTSDLIAILNQLKIGLSLIGMVSLPYDHCGCLDVFQNRLFMFRLDSIAKVERA